MRRYISIIATIAVLFCSCTEDQREPMGGSQNKPGNIRGVQVTSLPGKVRLDYLVPKDPDLLYVKAVYTLNSGVIREIKASYYTNNMILDGFGDANEHEVAIYTVNRAEVVSDPLMITVEPDKNPIFAVRESLKVSIDFGGINIQAVNPDQESVYMEIMTKDTLDTWNNLRGVETKSLVVNESRRGLDTLDYQVRILIRDRFFNYTQPLDTVLKPLFEKQLDKALFKPMALMGDATPEQGFTGMDKMFDNVYDYTNAHRFLTNLNPKGNTVPLTATFDMGQSAYISRVKVQNWADDNVVPGKRIFYYGEHLRHFEVWGTNEIPSPSGSLDNWTRLGEFYNIKPSGLPYTQQSQEDFDAEANGRDYTFSAADAKKVRYLRIRCISNWEGTTRMGIAELDVFGDPR